MIQHRECGVCLKYRADPEDTEGAGSDHGAYRRVERMTAAAQDARWDLIQIADRLKEQDAQDADGGAFYHSGFRCKKAGEKVSEQDDRKMGTELQTVDSPRQSHKIRLQRSHCSAAWFWLVKVVAVWPNAVMI